MAQQNSQRSIFLVIIASTLRSRSKEHSCPQIPCVPPQRPLEEIDTMRMQEGDQFVDFKPFGAAVQDWLMAGAHKFSVRYGGSDSLRNAARAHDDRHFRVSATYSSARQCVVVVSLGGQRNCIGAGPIGYGPSLQQTWLQRILPILTEHAVKLLERSMQFGNHRQV